MTDRLDRAIASYTRESLIELLSAAASSPGCAHRWPSAVVAFERVVRLTGTSGNRIAGPSDLRQLLDAARESRSDVIKFEDYLPHDPRWQVRARIGDELFAVHPSTSEMPLGEIRNHLRLAGALDPLLLVSHGFGISDVVELVLRHMDDCVTQLTPAWSDLPRTIKSSAKLTQREIRATGRQSAIESNVPRCRFPEQVERALFWGTRPASDFSVQFGVDAPAVPAALRLADRGATIPIPLAFLLDALQSCVATLCDELALADPGAGRQLQDAMQEVVAKTCDRLHRDVIGPWKWRLGEMTLAISYAGRRCLLVDVATGLNRSETSRDFDQRRAAMDEIASDEVFTAGPIEMRLNPSVEVIKVIVVAGPIGIRLNTPGVLVITLTDLEWILRRLEPDNDFYYFCREMCSPQGVTHIFRWSASDAWLAWRVYGGLYGGGEPLELAYIATGSGDADWIERIQFRPVEKLLAQYQLPPVDDWWHLQDEGSGLLLARQRPYEVWMVRPSNPVVLVKVAESSSSQHAGWMIDLAQTLLIRTNCPEAQHLLDQIGIGSISVHLSPTSIEDGLFAAEVQDHHRIDLRVDVERIRSGAYSGSQIQAAMGTNLIAALSAIGGEVVRHEAAALKQAWIASPAAILFHRLPLHQAAQDLDDPITIPDSLRKFWRRELGRSLRADGVQPQRVRQEAYPKFELSEIYPRLLTLLRERLALYDGTALTMALAVELERTICRRHHERLRLVGTVLLPEADVRIRRLQEIQEATTRQSRALGLLIEELVAGSGSSALVADQVDLSELIGLADLLLESALMRQTAAYGLQRIEAQISNRYEVSRTVKGHGRADLKAWQRAEAEAAVKSPKEEHELGPETLSTEQIQLPPELLPIDGAMRVAYGCGLVAIFACLADARTWPVTTDIPISRTTGTALANYVAEFWPIPAEELLAAIDVLTLRRSDLLTEQDSKGRLEHWKMESRAFRLATRPFVPVSEDELLLMPWRIGMSREVYLSYYSDGRLPWPEASMDPRLTVALKGYRKRRNRELEDDVAEQLRLLRLPFMRNVNNRKPDRIGLTFLSGEIDALAADARSATIWVIEAKDVGVAFSPPELARKISSFHDSDKYVDKLMRKVADIKKNPGAVAQSLGVHQPGSWRVKPLMVTRHIEPAAFVPSPVQFVTIDALSRVVSRPGTGRP